MTLDSVRIGGVNRTDRVSSTIMRFTAAEGQNTAQAFCGCCDRGFLLEVHTEDLVEHPQKTCLIYKSSPAKMLSGRIKPVLKRRVRPLPHRILRNRWGSETGFCGRVCILGTLLRNPHTRKGPNCPKHLLYFCFGGQM